MASTPRRPRPVPTCIVKSWQSSRGVVDKLDMESLLSQNSEVAQDALVQLSTAHDLHLSRGADVDAELAGHDPSLGDHACQLRRSVVEVLQTLGAIPELTSAVASWVIEVCRGTLCATRLLKRWGRFVRAAQKSTETGVWQSSDMAQQVCSLHLDVITALADSSLYICGPPVEDNEVRGGEAPRVCCGQKTNTQAVWETGEVLLQNFLEVAISTGLTNSRQKTDIENRYETLRPYQISPGQSQGLAMRDRINRQLCKSTRSVAELLLEGTASLHRSLPEKRAEVGKALMHRFPALSTRLQDPMSARSSLQPDLPHMSCEEADPGVSIEEDHEQSTPELGASSRVSSVSDSRFATPMGYRPMVEERWSPMAPRDSSVRPTFSERASAVSVDEQSTTRAERARRHEQSRRVGSVMRESPFDYSKLPDVTQKVREIRAPMPRKRLVKDPRPRVPWTKDEDKRFLQLLDVIGPGHWTVMKDLDERHPCGAKLSIRTTVDLKDRHRNIKNRCLARASRLTPLANSTSRPRQIKVENTTGSF